MICHFCQDCEVHCSKILTIQPNQPQGVSSFGNPRQASMGFNSWSLMTEIGHLWSGLQPHVIQGGPLSQPQVVKSPITAPCCEVQGSPLSQPHVVKSPITAPCCEVQGSPLSQPHVVKSREAPYHSPKLWSPLSQPNVVKSRDPPITAPCCEGQGSSPITAPCCEVQGSWLELQLTTTDLDSEAVFFIK